MFEHDRTAWILPPFRPRVLQVLRLDPAKQQAPDEGVPVAEMRGWLESRGGSYRARLRYPDGTNGPTKTFVLKRDARAWLDEQLAEFHKGTFLDQRLGKITFAEWADQWQASTVHLSRSSRARHKTEMQKWILPVFKDRPIGAIKPPEVQRWISKMVDSGCAAGSINTHFRTFSACLQAAVNAELIQRNPCRKINLPTLKNRETHFLTLQEIGLLADTIGEKYRALIWLGATGGLRIGELAGLELHHLDFFRSRVTVEQQMTFVDGTAAIERVKTKMSVRNVALPRSTTRELQAHAERYELDKSDLVFTGPKGDWLHTNSFRSNTFHTAAKAAGLAPLVPHDLRHTAVSLWIASGANPKEIQRMAGHSTIQTTFNVYGHLFDDHDEHLAAGIDRFYEETLQLPRLKLV